MHEMPKLSHSEVPASHEPYIISKADSQLFRGWDDLFMRYEFVPATHGTLGQAVQVEV